MDRITRAATEEAIKIAIETAVYRAVDSIVLNDDKTSTRKKSNPKYNFILYFASFSYSQTVNYLEVYGLNPLCYVLILMLPNHIDSALILERLFMKKIINK
ncbi:unnamed protein product [Rotaria sordida]|uniref:Uncharacterized protein n=1 Tax=Rotaria sordida TaxID=392033 RepID=A0A815VDB2_9BILA|nr:unnamed protein product [Rotaria sordida]